MSLVCVACGDGWFEGHVCVNKEEVHRMVGIRELSEYEQKSLRDARVCPFCETSFDDFHIRARGGLSTNYYCPCGAGFNLASFQGKYVLAELIAEPEKQPEDPEPSFEELVQGEISREHERAGREEP